MSARVVLVDGAVAASPVTGAVSLARRFSRLAPDASVAVCRLGPTASHTLRRFAAGQEITR